MHSSFNKHTSLSCVTILSFKKINDVFKLGVTCHPVNSKPFKKQKQSAGLQNSTASACRQGKDNKKKQAAFPCLNWTAISTSSALLQYKCWLTGLQHWKIHERTDSAWIYSSLDAMRTWNEIRCREMVELKKKREEGQIHTLQFCVKVTANSGACKDTDVTVSLHYQHCTWREKAN